MTFSPTGRIASLPNAAIRHPAGLRIRKRFITRIRIRHYWHHGAAWLIGPLPIGLAAVGFAYGSEYANDINKG